MEKFKKQQLESELPYIHFFDDKVLNDILKLINDDEDLDIKDLDISHQVIISKDRLGIVLTINENDRSQIVIECEQNKTKVSWVDN